MKTPRILILVMSCNQDFFNYATQVIHSTWLKDCVNYPNIKYYIYTGGYDNSYCGNYNIYCTAKDDLDHTFEKTQEAFFLSDACRYDYVVRVNTSTLVNLELLNRYLIEQYNKEGEQNFSCGDICILKRFLELRGNSMIIPKWFTKEIIDFDINTLPIDIENTHDDIIISWIYQNHFDKSVTDIIKDNVNFTPCIYYNDPARQGHPCAVYDDSTTNLNDLANFIFIAYRKNQKDRFSELGECYKLYHILKEAKPLDNLDFNKFNTNKLVWDYNVQQFIFI